MATHRRKETVATTRSSVKDVPPGSIGAHYTTVPSQRDKPMLILDGYRFHRERQARGRSYWSCVQKRTTRCKGRAITIGTATGEKLLCSTCHHHAPSVAEVETAQLVAGIKEEAAATKDIPAVVIQRCCKRASQEAVQHMPSKRALKQVIRRRRRNGRVAKAKTFTCVRDTSVEDVPLCIGGFMQRQGECEGCKSPSTMHTPQDNLQTLPCSSLSHVNCTQGCLGPQDTARGSNLTDVSIFKEMPSLEVLNLSTNNITSLEDISHCHNLKELYLRRNSIQNIEELFHLKSLPHLKVLWLAGNPCSGSDSDKYRMTVLRNLPNLHRLDNQMTEEEVAKAAEEGEEITSPPKTEANDDGIYVCKIEEEPVEPAVETEADPLNFSMEETNKIREQLGMKLLTRDKFSTSASPEGNSSIENKRPNVLNAVLLLLKELNVEGLEVVRKTAESKLRALKKRDLQEES
ncbi:uncharacterized protein CFAP410 isoform X2 [Protopterus annectens]|uniref:uncharacterized protein CFAP410 isoform X2 n=1 Tax=Protopterus annectens TaxID=7888 RepID=UPI001CFC318F|nr:uncharacterized protein CFAP410 isoform X2 [Protopterus annectens]